MIRRESNFEFRASNDSSVDQSRRRTTAAGCRKDRLLARDVAGSEEENTSAREHWIGKAIETPEPRNPVADPGYFAHVSIVADPQQVFMRTLRRA